MELNRNNYYSLEADRHYMSVSQYNDFVTCEAMAMAKLRGDYRPAPSIDMLLGSYIHAWCEGTLNEFMEEHPEMFSGRGATKGQIKSEFQRANRMIETLQNDPFCMFVLNGQKEVIMTGELFGVPWKIRIDVYSPKGNRRIVDLKTTRSINDLVWSTERWARVSFVDAHNYPRQFAIYSEIERLNTGNKSWAEPFIVAVSKEDPPDKAIISLLDEYRFRSELAQVEEKLPRILQVKAGLVEPMRCEKCAYCRETKLLSRVIHYTEIGA